MTTLATTHPTLLDLKSRLDKNGNVLPVIEMLAQQNEVVDDAVWIEANELTGHTWYNSGHSALIIRTIRLPSSFAPSVNAIAIELVLNEGSNGLARST